jgi:hypothetical protein
VIRVLRRASKLIRRAVKGSKTRQLRKRFAANQAAGYRFHQEAVAAHRWLHEWVLRPDYWDYRIPREALRGRDGEHTE